MGYKNSFKILARHLFVFIMSAALLTVSSLSFAYSQEHTVTGTVTHDADGTALPGVSIVQKGTTHGTVTNLDGHYSIRVDDRNAVLVYSYVGYETTEISIDGQSVINVALKEGIELDEVVVTALGIRREERSLGYSISRVGGEEMTRVAQENVLNSIAGKVTGVTISSTGGTGSTVSMVIRGATSLSSDNQPLFVVDGVPMFNSANNVGGFGSRNLVDYGNAISDLNPEDIADVSILKGPSAAALYGTRAGNGVVLITTKQAGYKADMEISVTSNTVFDIPYSFVNVHSQFASGFFPFTPEDVGSKILPEVDPSDGSASGPELNRGYWAVQWNAPLDQNGVPIATELISYPNNVRNFVNTGFTTTNGISVSNSTDIVNFRLGATNMTHSGLVPNSDLSRNSFVLSASSRTFDNLVISANVNYTQSGADNRPSGDRGTNAMEAAYTIPANIDIRELKDYWVPGAEGLEVRTVSSVHDNPYFIAHEVNNSFNRNNVFGNMVADWQISPSFSIMGRYALNRSDDTQETKMAPGYSREPNNGAYGIRSSERIETNVDMLATYTRDWENFHFSASGGGNILYSRSARTSNSSASGTGLIVPNVFTIQNISSTSLNYSSSSSQRGVNSLYALANFGYRNMLYLDLTARNDWSSTLPVENHSYFYPSASLSFLVDEAIDLGRNVNMLKLRGGWAQVGNDTSPYSLYSVYGNAGQWGDAIRLRTSGTLLTPDLKPEQATSREIGIDLRIFNNRVRFDGTYYQVENRNQILGNIPLTSASGYTNIKLNTGLLESQGIEMMLGVTPVRTSDWNWDLNVNFTRNETRIMELADGVELIELWSSARINAWGFPVNEELGHDGMVGNLYSFVKKRVTDENSPYYGYPLLKEGLGASWVTSDENVKIGNYNPDFIMGLQSRLRFRNFTLSATFDWRSGGQYMSQTYRYFADRSQTQYVLDRRLIHPGELQIGQELRDWIVENSEWIMMNEDFLHVGGPTREYGGFPENYSGFTVYNGVFTPGVYGYHDDEGNFILDRENLGNEGTIVSPYVAHNPWDFGTQAVFDADYIKIRELSLGFQLPQGIAERLRFKSASISVYSRNILLWTKDSHFGIDPERAFQPTSSTGNRGIQFQQGIERYNVDPRVIPIGFRLGLNF